MCGSGQLGIFRAWFGLMFLLIFMCVDIDTFAACPQALLWHASAHTDTDLTGSLQRRADWRCWEWRCRHWHR